MSTDATHSPALRWETGGSAEVTSVVGVHVVVRSSRPFPPGAPVAGTLSATSPLGFTLKVAGSRKVGENVWEVRGRLVSATTEVLTAFAESIAAVT